MQQTCTDISPDSRRVIETILYFDIFSHPLTAAEIAEATNIPGINIEKTQEILKELVLAGLLVQQDQFYSVKSNPEWVTRRQEANQRAVRYHQIALRMGRWIGSFPFVRAVFVSGSLSKGVMPADGDIDYFIITSPGRLWIARSFLVIFKKVFLFNSKKYFCVNYFVDESHQRIEENNLFTATEVVTLLPVYGSDYYEGFLKANAWVSDYYPNFPARILNEVPRHRKGIFKYLGEKLLGNRFGDWLDQRFMRTTVKYWNKKFKTLSPEEFAVAMKSRRYVSKHHPQHFQRKVLDRFLQNLHSFENQHGIKFRQHEAAGSV